MVSIYDFADYLSDILEVTTKLENQKKLSDFNKIKFSKEVIEKYKSKDNLLRHADYSDNGYLWTDSKDNLVCYVAVDNEMKGNYKYITALEVTKDYRRLGLGQELVKFAVNELGANALTVNPNNKAAIALYKKCGFKRKTGIRMSKLALMVLEK